MRRTSIIAGLLVTCLVAGGAAADPASGPYARVPAGQWPYHSVRELVTSGYFTGYPDAMFADGKTLTRYDFAVALQRMTDQAERRVVSFLDGRAGVPGAVPEGWNTETAMGAEIAALRRLAAEFGLEYASLGQDLQALENRLAGLARRLTEREGVRPPSPRPAASGQGAALAGRRPPARPLFYAGGLAAPDAMPSPRYGLEAQVRGLLPSAGASAGPAAGGRLAGPLSFSIAAAGSDPLHYDPARPAFADPALAFATDARLDLSLGKYQVSGIYKQVGSQYAGGELWLPRGYGSVRGLSGFGGAVRAPLGNLFALELEGASLRDGDGEATRELLFLKSGIQMTLGRALTLDLGYERLQSDGSALSGDVAEQYNVGLGHQFGRNARVELLYQFTNLHRSLLGEGQGSLFDGGAHSAVTQFQVRF